MTTPTPPPPGPPPPPTPPPGFLARVKARVDAIGGIVTVLGATGTIVVAGIGTTQGYVQRAYDYFVTAEKTTSQVSALDERLKLVEAEKTVLQKDRVEVARIASELKATADRLAQTGVDVTTMRELLQRLEVKLATLDGVLDGMRDRRRK